MSLLTRLERFSNEKIIPGRQKIRNYEVDIVDLDNLIGINIDNTKDKFDLVQELRNYGFKTLINGNFDIEVTESKINLKENTMSKARNLLRKINEASGPFEARNFIDNLDKNELKRNVENEVSKVVGQKVSLSVGINNGNLRIESGDISANTRPKYFRSLRVVSSDRFDFSSDRLIIALKYLFEMADGKLVESTFMTVSIAADASVSNVVIEKYFN